MIQLNTETPPVTGSTRDVLLEPVSASRLNLFHGCRLRFYFRYVLGLQKPASPALHVGKSVHRSLQNWSQRRWLGKPAAARDLKDEFLSAWREQLEAEPVGFDDPSEEEKEKQKAWGLVEMYLHETPIPVEEKPEAVEVLVERDLHEHGLPVLRGVIDLVRPGGRIVDFKTTSTAPHEQLVLHRNETQLSCYALLYREATGKREKGFELHHLVKTKTPKLVVTEHRSTGAKAVPSNRVLHRGRHTTGLGALPGAPVHHMRILQRVPERRHLMKVRTNLELGLHRTRPHGEVFCTECAREIHGLLTAVTFPVRCKDCEMNWQEFVW